MAEKNIKISGIGDVTRADFVRAITDPDKFKEFADQQGWGNKRRQLAWNSLHNYAQGVQNGEINEINDMHQIVDDTGARTNKQEKYNWIGSKFDANGATAAFMNQIAKGMQTASKPADKSLKNIPSVTSYLNQQWFGSNNPDWELFQKNDTLTNGVYGIANRSAKIKEGLTKYKNELTTNGAQYNWDGVDKDALYKNLDAAIASSNVATYAPLGITSDYISNALATKDLSTMVSDADTGSAQTQSTEDDPTKGFSEEELARYNTMTPEQQQQYLAQRQQIINLNNAEALTKNQAEIDAANKRREDEAFTNWLKANGYYSPKAQASSYVTSRLAQSSMVDSKGKRLEGPAVKSGKEFDKATNINSFTPQEWNNFIHGDLTSDTHNTYSLKNADRHTTNGNVAIKSKLDWLNYNFQQLLDTGKLNEIGDDVSSYIGASKGTVWRLKNSKRNSDGTYMYMRKRGNNLEFYRSKSWGDLRNNEYKKHISKHQWGGGISSGQAKLREQYSKDLKARQDAIKSQKKMQQANSIERTPLRDQRDPNRIKAGQRELGNLGQLTGTDKLQIAGIFADIGSTVSSFAGPAGNLIGAGAGVVGTGLHAAADFNDPSVSKAEAFTNLGANLLFDAAGVVPILGSYGKLAKLGRVGRALQNNARLYKLVLGTVTAPGIIQAAPNAANAIKKLVTKPTTITADELRDLSTAVSIATGMIKVAPNHDKIRTTNPNYGKDVIVHTNKGKQTIPAKQYEAMMDKTKNPTMRDRNEALEAATKVKGIQFDNGIFHNYAPSSNNPLKLEGFYGKWGIVSRLGNTSDPETKYIFRPAKTLKNQNSKTSKPITGQDKPAQNQPTITNNPEKPLQTHNITPEQQKRDIELLRKRFMSDKPLPIDNATRKAYEHYRKRPMTDQEIKDLEAKQQQKQSRQQKASEVMEAFGNTKSNNTKRRQDGGILYDYEFLKSVHAFKQGGVIKAQGGVKLNNIWAGKNQDYGYNTYLNRIFGDQDVLSWMRTHYVGDNATKQYADYVMKNVNDRNTYGVNNYNNDSTYVANKGINTFNTGYQNAGNTLNYTLFGNNTKDYTDKKGVAYGLINFTRPDKALATGDSYNANPSKAYIDNALGLQTYSRVASLTDSGIKAGGFGDWGKYWKEQGNTGAYYYIAPGDTSGKGQWIPTKDKTLNGYQDFEAAPQETPKKDGSVTTPGIGKKSIFDKGKEYLSKLTSNPGNLYNAVETGKYLLANKATNDIFKIKAPNYVISPKHTSYQVMDNLAQQNAYHSKAAEAMNQTSRPLTSSGQLQTAAQQESINNANKLYLQGNAERNTRLEGQKEQSYKAGLYNMESAVDTANANAQQAYKTRLINEYQDPRVRIRGLATNRQNWINALEEFNVIDPYVERKNAQQQYGLAKAQWDYQNDAKVLLAQQKYQQLLRQHQNDLNFNASDTPEYKALVEAQKEAGAKYYNNMYQVYGISNPGFKYKKGGKFEDISKFNTKEFYNTIRHSINTATKQSGDLSKLINTLFKKSNKK